jgi:hypothetical protein
MAATRRAVLATLVVLALVALLVWSFLASREEVAAEAEREKPVAAPTRVVVESGETVVRLDAETLERAGLGVVPLAASAQRPQQLAFGTVLDATALGEAQRAYLAARTDIEKASANLAVAHREHERLAALNADDKNVSDKAVEAGLAAYQSAQADVEAAEATARAALVGAEQQLGPALADRMKTPGALAPFLSLAQVAVQITLPADAVLPANTITLQLHDGPAVAAQLLGPAARTDAKLQGRTYLYVAPGAPAGLLPGTNVQARLPTGDEMPGVLVPTAAVVWSQGGAWVYVERRPGAFARQPVALDNPVPEGWFVTGGVVAGERVVVVGAQLLLSEEQRSQLQVGEQGEKD